MLEQLTRAPSGDEEMLEWEQTAGAVLQSPQREQTAGAALQSLQREQTQDQQVWRPLGEAEQGQQVQRPELMTEQVTKLMIEQGTEVAVVVVVEVVVVVVLLSLQKTREMAGRAHMSLQRRQEWVQTLAAPTQGVGRGAEAGCILAGLTSGTGTGPGADKTPAAPTQGVGIGAGVNWFTGALHPGIRNRHRLLLASCCPHLRSWYRCRGLQSFIWPGNWIKDQLGPTSPHPGN